MSVEASDNSWAPYTDPESLKRIRQAQEEGLTPEETLERLKREESQTRAYTMCLDI